MSKLLVTGGAGFIGTNFALYWMDRNPKDSLIVLDALTYAGRQQNLQSLESRDNFDFVHGSICDQELVERVLSNNEIDTLVHFAAESHVDRSISGPDPFIDTNIVGTYTLLKAAKSIWIDSTDGRKAHRFHHVSTDEVYGSLKIDDPAFSETTAYSPNSPYAASKAASDHLVRSYHQTFGLEITMSNCSNNYGPYQYPEKFIPLVVVNALMGKPLPLYGDGSNIRDWIHVDDHCSGIELIIKDGVVGQTYNVGGGNEWSNVALIKELCKKIDALFAADPSLRDRYPDSRAANGDATESSIVSVPDRAGHDWRYAIESKKISSELGYAPKVSMSDGLDWTIRWLIDNESWWRDLIDTR